MFKAAAPATRDAGSALLEDVNGFPPMRGVLVTGKP